MDSSVAKIADHIRNHRCFSHPIFENWAEVRPSAETVGALFHQIQCFCASTRPGGRFPEALAGLGLDQQSHLLQEIVESEENHGPELATMAGFIMNRAAGTEVCNDLYDQTAVESVLRDCSDHILGNLPGYDLETGLALQTRRAIAVFARRNNTDPETTYRNLGTAVALEMISNRQLIPGEKHCLVDSGIYDADIDQPEMHYLLEHWGEAGAEIQHEKNAFEALESIVDKQTLPVILAGVDDFLNALVGLWDLLDSALLGSGQKGVQRPGARVAA
jgi:hypothetical protein